ncbi:MAG: hypothetical protein EOP11_17905, partial [Proteobacteria bacterium]
MYLTIKPFLVLAAMGLAFTYFFIKVKVLIDLARAVTTPGPGPERYSNVPARLGWFFKDVLGQSSVRRKVLPGIAHSMIFWGFLVITIGTLEMMVDGIFHGVNLSVFGMQVWSGYQFVAEIMIVGVLLGVAFGFFRRLVLRPHYLHSGPEAYAILTLTAGLMFALLFMNAFHVGGDAGVAHAFPVSSILANVFFGGGLSPTASFVGMEVFYWAHLLLVLGFLAYVPNSKHLHILAAAPNVFLKHLGTPK